MEIDGFGGENPMVMEAILYCFSLSVLARCLCCLPDACLGELSIPYGIIDQTAPLYDRRIMDKKMLLRFYHF